MPYAAQLHDFPSYLNVLDKNLEHQLGTPKHLALRHTLLGYFLPIQEPNAATSILEAVCSGGLRHLKYKLGIPASGVGGHHPLKGCPRCFDDDVTAHGRAYWHVEHQFPSTMVCVKHRCSLRVAWDPVTPVHRRGWILPQMGLHRQWIEIPIMDSAQTDRLLRLATFSAHWASREPGSLDPFVLAATYQAALKSRGLATPCGSLRLTKVVPEIRSHYAGLENLPGFEVLQSVRPDWSGLAGSLARRVPRRGHPLKHLLLISLLFDSWPAFLDSYAAQKESVNSDANPSNEVDKTTDDRIEQFQALVIEQGLSITAAARQIGVTTSTGVRWAKILGIAFTPRTKNLTEEKFSQVRSALKMGLDKAEIWRVYDISAASLNRLISSEPTLARQWRCARREKALQTNRTRFLGIVRAHPGWTITQIRTITGSGYAWLYRHDRDWLVEHLPSIWLPLQD